MISFPKIRMNCAAVLFWNDTPSLPLTLCLHPTNNYNQTQPRWVPFSCVMWTNSQRLKSVQWLCLQRWLPIWAGQHQTAGRHTESGERDIQENTHTHTHRGPYLAPSAIDFLQRRMYLASCTRHKADFLLQQTAAATLAPGEACRRKAEACSGANETWCYFCDLKNAPLQSRNWSPNTWSKCPSG